MKFTMACSTWIKENDEIVLKILQKADKMPTVDELMEMTGLPRFQIENTLRMWRMQVRMAESRKRMRDDDDWVDKLLGPNWRDELLKDVPEEEDDDEEVDFSSIDWGGLHPAAEGVSFFRSWGGDKHTGGRLPPLP